MGLEESGRSIFLDPGTVEETSLVFYCGPPPLSNHSSG